MAVAEAMRNALLIESLPSTRQYADYIHGDDASEPQTLPEDCVELITEYATKKS